MFNRIPPAGTGGSFNLCSTESHRREPVDRSIYVQPNPTGGNRWIVQFMFNRIPPAGAGGSFNPSLQGLGRFPQNPTTGRWWIVQVQPARSTTENRGRD